MINLKRIMPLMAGAMMTAGAAYAQNNLGSGLDVKNMDLTVKPGTDFYHFACGGWMKDNPLTAEYSRYGSFDVLQENNNQKLKGIIEECAAKHAERGSLEQKIGSMYLSVMDSVKLNREGMMPILADLDRVRNAQDVASLLAIQYELQHQGVPGFFNWYIDADIKDSQNNLLLIGQGGLTLGQKDYYVENDSTTVGIRVAYRSLIHDLMVMAGYSDAEAGRVAEDVLRIETRIAHKSLSPTQLRDNEANYHKMSYETLLADYPGIDWNAYFHAQNISGVKDLSLGQPVPLHEVEAIFAEEDINALRHVVAWHLVDAASSCLDDKVGARSFDFYGRVMSGKQVQRPRWKRAVSAVEGSLGQALGRLYVERYFPAKAKGRMEQLVWNLQVALGERIDVQDWMSPETKKVAHEKLDAFYVKVGYPNEWLDYSALPIGDCYWENVKASAAWELDQMVAKKLNKPVDHDEWYMTPQTVNAYYNPTTNEICFPAGILQPPFFDMDADDAFNYGAIGVVIGHEMTHGFDDQGSKFDKNGNLVQWWTDEDTKRFTERIQVMTDFHDRLEVLPGLNANGSLTLGENMADHGGLMVAFRAFQNATKSSPLKKVDGFTPEQRFFLAYAGVWGQNIREEEIRKRVKSDPHQLGMWRVNGQLPHLDAWYDAFGITRKDPMFVPKEKRVTIW